MVAEEPEDFVSQVDNVGTFSRDGYERLPS